MHQIELNTLALQRFLQRSFNFISPALLTFALMTNLAAYADEESDQPNTERENDASNLETVTIVATQPEQFDRKPSAVTVIGPDQLNLFSHSDIQRILRQVPGVALQVEDGFGLRPNISIRGVASERSGRITLLEDNVLIAPAPYSAPSAYYFPTAGRMHRMEILKGATSIAQGPYTIGGVLNLISTPVESSSRGSADIHLGKFGSQRIHAWQNFANNGKLSVLLETHLWFADGFQEIDRSDTNTGLDIRDYTAKFKFEPTSNQSIEVKVQFADQTSQQSYLGLTDADFSSDPYRRYGVSDLDEITTSHQQFMATYRVELGENTFFRTTAYRNTHERAWFKTEGIDFDGSESAETLNRTSWSNVIYAVNTQQNIGNVSWSDMSAILNGDMDTPPGSIQIRSNARDYISQGWQFWVSHQLELGETSHQIEASFRIHEDEEDRLQRNSSYHQENGSLVLDDWGLLGNAGNRIQEARATAFYIQDTIDMGNLTIQPGLRFEDIQQNRTRYEIRSGRTTNPASRNASNLRSTRQNSTKVWSPGLGISYQTSDSVVVFAGTYRGFSAPSNASGVDEESAWIYETGIRYVSGTQPMKASLVGFLTDYDNLLGECTASSGSDCEVGDAFNGNAATVRGMEFQASLELAQDRVFSWPVNVNFTLFSAQFDNDIADTDFFGHVSKGDPIPYLPESQFNVSTGYVLKPIEAYVTLVRVGEVCVRASCGAFEKVKGSTTIDASLKYQLHEWVTLNGRIENLTNEQSIVSRHPYGARPNMPRTISLGIKLDW